MTNNNFEDESVYSDEEYEQAGYGKEIIVSDDEIDLELSDQLRDRNIVQKFIKHKKHKFLKLELNHKYEKSTFIFQTNNIKDWSKFHDTLDKEFDRKGIKDEEDIRLIHNDIDNNHELILGLNQNNNNKNDEQQQEVRETEGKKERQLLAQIIVELAQQNIEKLFMNEFGNPYALVKINNHFEVLPIKNNGGRFEDYLSKLYYDNFDGNVASAEAINNAKRTLRAIARFEGSKIPLYLRIAWANQTKDAIYYDMTDENRRCIKITKDGWEIVENQIQVLFNRFGHELPQVEPSHDYDPEVLDKFVDSLNLSSESDKILVKVWIISLLIPEIGIPAVFPFGAEGSAKTSFQKKIRKIIDPSSYDPFSISSDKKEYIQQITHNFFCPYDNVRYEPKWLSDEFCRDITGGSFSKRELYSDDEDIPYKYKKRMSFSGINNIFQQPDAQDRLIRIELERLDPKKKIEEDVIDDELKQQIPQLLGYILDIISKALDIKKSIVLEKEDKPRMVDFAAWGEAIGRAMGYEPKKFLNAYFENIGKQKIEIIENDTFTEALSRFIDYDKQSWISQLPIFIQNLKQYADENNIDSSQFPKKPTPISNKLRRAKASLLEGLGIEIVLERITKGIGNNKKLKNTAIVKIRKRAPLAPPAPLDQNDEGNAGNIGGADLDSGALSSTQTLSAPPEDSRNYARNEVDLVKSGAGGAGGADFTNLSEPSKNGKSLLFNNPLISEEDLQSPDGYKYDPEIINNIGRYGNSDTWYCKKHKCNVRGDKWVLMKHDCKYRNIKNEMEEDLN